MKRIMNALTLPLAGILLAGLASQAVAQFGGPPPAIENAQAEAPYDIEGYWVSLVTEDWRFRMVVPEAGDYALVPLSALGRQVADGWDPTEDVRNGDECKAYGVGNIMRMPTRLNISWQGDNVLQIQTDAGRQTRQLKFGAAQDGAGSGTLQGVSNARLDLTRQGFGGPVESGAIVVETTDMAPGYFRRNGLPYSDQATVTEYFNIVEDRDGTEYLMVLTVLEDPVYLTGRFITSSNFKRTDDSGWNPTECMVR